MTKTVTPDELLGIDSVFSDEDLDSAKVVRKWMDEYVRDDIGSHFLNGTLPVRELSKGLGDLGLLGMHLDGYGCAGTSATMYGLACRELEAVDAGLRSMVSVQGSLSMFAIHRFGSQEQKQAWLPAMAAGDTIGCFGLTEHDAGSDPGAMRTKAKRDGSGDNADWILDGVKMWITNAPVADVVIVWAKTEELDAKGRPTIRGFIVPTDTPGVSVTEITDKISLRASITGEVTLDGVRLPADAMLPEAQGLRGPLSCLSEARFGIVFGVTGAARDALTTAIDYSATRVQFDRPIAGFQLTQAKLANAASQYATTTLLAGQLGRLKDAGTIRPEQISLGKMNNVSTAMQVCRDLRAVLGGAGITADFSPIRHAVNLETVLTYEGTHEVHQLSVGRALTGINAFA